MRSLCNESTLILNQIRGKGFFREGSAPSLTAEVGEKVSELILEVASEMKPRTPDLLFIALLFTHRMNSLCKDPIDHF